MRARFRRRRFFPDFERLLRQFEPTSALPEMRERVCERRERLRNVRVIGTQRTTADGKRSLEQRLRVAILSLFGERLPELPERSSNDGMFGTESPLPRIDRTLMQDSSTTEVSELGVQDRQVVDDGGNVLVIGPDPFVCPQGPFVERPRRRVVSLDEQSSGEIVQTVRG